MSNSIIRGQGAPTANTEGAVGQIYVDTDSGIQYRCILCADGDGGVKLATEEFLYYHPIIAVDTENTLVTFMM